MLIKCYPGSIVDPGGEKGCPETRKEECGPPVFLGIATLFFFGYIITKKGGGRFSCTGRRVCSGQLRLSGDGESMRAR